MKEFKTIDELHTAFMSGEFKLDETIVVTGVKWTLLDSAPVNIRESVTANKCPAVLYTCEDTNKTLVFAWQTTARNAIHPSGVAIVEGSNYFVKREDQLIIEMHGEKITIRPDQLIGDVARVSFAGLSNPKELQGKVDTGATVSSLHADNYKINGNQISFTCQALSPNTITVPLKTQHAVKSPDGGTVYRPVIELDVKINGKMLNSVMFNLNDRSHMDQPVLIGQNILQAGKFYVDPTRTESVEGIDWNGVQLTVEALPILHRHTNDEVLKEFYAKMLESDITFKDLVQHIRYEVIKTFEDIE